MTSIVAKKMAMIRALPNPPTHDPCETKEQQDLLNKMIAISRLPSPPTTRPHTILSELLNGSTYLGVGKRWTDKIIDSLEILIDLKNKKKTTYVDERKLEKALRGLASIPAIGELNYFFALMYGWLPQFAHLTRGIEDVYYSVGQKSMLQYHKFMKTAKLIKKMDNISVPTFDISNTEHATIKQKKKQLNFA